MTELRQGANRLALRPALLSLVAFALLVSLMAPLSAPARSTASDASLAGSHDPLVVPDDTAAQLVLEGNLPSEVAAGVTVVLSWEALDAYFVPVPTYSLIANLTVTVPSNGSGVPAWVNSSIVGPLVSSADNSSFAIPTDAWHDGWLNLSVTFRESTSLLVRLRAPALPPVVDGVALEVLPDLAQLVLSHPGPYGANTTARSNETFWRVRDRFGDPTPGAALIVRSAIGPWENDVDVPVSSSPGGGTGAWVNYSLPGNASGSVEVLDEAGAVVLGPITIPAVVPPATTSNASSSASAPESPFVLGLAALVVLAGVAGIVSLTTGGRAKAPLAPTGPEDDLRRLAEGRANVVELVRRTGPLTIHEIEAAWDPPPAPPAVADWVASLVTDGTLTATLDGGGVARFAVAERAGSPPQVTLDEEELERGIARRDAAVEEDDDRGGDPR